MQLRLTRRALTDVELNPEEFCRRDASEYTGDDSKGVVAAFVEQRSQLPHGQEWTVLPVTRVSVSNLHHGRWRGLTWEDRAAGVVWLLGVEWHESGSLADAYAVLKNRDVSGDLMPDEQDYVDLEATYEEGSSFVARVALECPRLLLKACSEPGREIRECIAERVDVCVVVDEITENGDTLTEVWIAICQSPRPPIPADWMSALVASMTPDAVDSDSIEWGCSGFPRPGGVAPNEFVVRFLLGT